MAKTPKALKTKFSGKGEVLGYMFTQLEKSVSSYLWEVKNDENGSVHYEVFKKKINNRFNSISYPRSKAFGIWAWTTPDLDRAYEILREKEPTQDSLFNNKVH